MGLYIWLILIIAFVLYFVVPDQPIGKIDSKQIYVPPIKKEINNNGSIGEKECRKLLEDCFNMPFPSIRPNFLRNPETGRNLEIDCFNPVLKLGVEYNGKQHYSYSDHFHRGNSDSFVSQIDRDEFKINKCKQLGIYIISVPYTVPKNSIPIHLLKKLHKRGFTKFMVPHYRDYCLKQFGQINN